MLNIFVLCFVSLCHHNIAVMTLAAYTVFYFFLRCAFVFFFIVIFFFFAFAARNKTIGKCAFILCALDWIILGHSILLHSPEIFSCSFSSVVFSYYYHLLDLILIFMNFSPFVRNNSPKPCTSFTFLEIIHVPMAFRFDFLHPINVVK